MKRDAYTQLLQECETLVRAGRGNLVRQKLAKIQPAKLPASLKVAFARLSRRVNLPNFALRCLSRVVSTAWQKTAQIPIEEKTEYAASLLRVGAVEEARSILLPHRKDNVPEVSLYLAFSHVVRSEYAESIPYLQTYLASPDLKDYSWLIGKVNLAAALVFEQRSEDAHELIDDLHDTLVKSNGHLLLSEVLQLGAQLAIDDRDFKGARALIDEATQLLEDKEGLTAFFIEKWRAVISLAENPCAATLATMSDIEAQAVKLEHFESVRDCHFQRVRYSKDKALADQLYCGTPSERYRERLARTAPNWEAPECFDWQLGTRSTIRLDLDAVHTSAMTSPLKAGHFVHRLLTTLCSDFYRPWSVGALFARVCPNEHYHPHFSAQRMYQGVLKLRRWIKANKLPLLILQTDNGYRLGTPETKGLTIRVPAQLMMSTSQTLQSQIKQKMGAKPFSAREVIQLLDLPKWSTIRRLNKGIEEGWLTVQKRGPKTLYSLVNSADSTISQEKAA